ncbi:hypothetical protein GGP41_007192 [Bipolaris sorokiniana]|uniref:Uncharacterized protein n=1 Tax=Cochliobolus sativus TaxID=45130 RepID=A0A8H5ZSI1_COCSA|nr:hypothetical protein GGP41_007192 [Bipolaris sorokiniana]
MKYLPAPKSTYCPRRSYLYLCLTVGVVRFEVALRSRSSVLGCRAIILPWPDCLRLPRSTLSKAKTLAI